MVYRYRYAFGILYSVIATFLCTAQQENLHPALTQKNIPISIDVPSGDFVHKDQMLIHTDHPHAQVISWRTDIDAITKYDTTFEEDKKVFDRSFIINALVQYPSDTQDAHIRVSYYRHSAHAVQETIAPIEQANNRQSSETLVAQSIDSDETQIHQTQDVTHKDRIDEEPAGVACYVQGLVQKTDNIWLRLFLVLLLGVLMSLTPCIYPMIPITIGILQAQGSRSMSRNFLLASCYTLGIATMFALLGLLAASTGQMFGAIMANPVVILGIVALLAYLAFSMLGFYEMYVPRFMVSNNTRVKGGSFLSVFLFGFFSGSVASPCLSPGLILLLTIVTALKSKLLGFALLFSFGVGLSLPLLIVGTFSSALNALPQAGMWMVEVKKVFGIMLIGMCFYFLNMIMPWYILMTMITISSLLIGIFYLYQAQKSTQFVRRMNSLLGMIFIALTLVLCVETYKAFNMRNQCPVSNDLWFTEYQCAKEKALALNKPLLLKVGGPCCSMCTAIDNKQFAHTGVLEMLAQSFVPVKIDGSQMNEDVAHIKRTYTILGFPTILIIDPKNETIIKQWGSNLYDVDPSLFEQELQMISAAF